MSRCSCCALSTAVPGIYLDEQGVCNVCQKQERQHNTDVRDYAAMLKADLERYRGQGKYDAIVCLSGGKDSSWALTSTVRTHGLRVLAFTLDNGFLSRYALDNIHAVVDSLGVDHLMVRPNKQDFRQIVKASATQKIYNTQTLRRISSVCQSCITLVINEAVSLAVEKQAPVIVGGFTLGQVPRGRFGYELSPRVLNEMRADVVSRMQEHVSPAAAANLLLPAHLLNAAAAPQLVNPLCAVEMDEQEILAQITPLGWQQPQDVDGCSSNCRLNAFANYAHEQRYGYNPYELELADLVRRGLMSRDDMLDKLGSGAHSVRTEIMQELGLNV